MRKKIDKCTYDIIKGVKDVTGSSKNSLLFHLCQSFPCRRSGRNKELGDFPLYNKHVDWLFSDATPEEFKTDRIGILLSRYVGTYNRLKRNYKYKYRVVCKHTNKYHHKRKPIEYE